MGHCPFHDDRTPSLVITPAKNEWHCLGACNEGGDVIRWVMKTRGVSFRHAVELLQANHSALGGRCEVDGDVLVRERETEKGSSHSCVTGCFRCTLDRFPFFMFPAPVR